MDFGKSQHGVWEKEEKEETLSVNSFIKKKKNHNEWMRQSKQRLQLEPYNI